jgi:Questin oxidase-like
MQTSSYAALDTALETITPFGIALKNGNSNHAPMVAEALCALGRPEAVRPWLDRYRARMELRPAPGALIGVDWRAVLGRRERFADWAVFFAAELAQAPWAEVLDRWVDRLAPGFSAAATHGPIRVGHAVRALADAETPARRRELGDALAAWAATYSELPAADGAAAETDPQRALAAIPIVPPERRRPGNIVARLGGLAEFPPFAPAIGLLDTGGRAETLLAALAETFARVFVAHARDIPSAIAFVHCVTGLAALGNFAPHLEAESRRRALRYAWQAAAGIYASYAGPGGLPETVAAEPSDVAGLPGRAIGNGDEHVIKFTEACLRHHAAQPSPAYPAAAEHLLGMMPRR